MPASEILHFSPLRRHALLAMATMALLGATLWMIGADRNRSWHRHQRVALQRVEPWRTAARSDGSAAIEFGRGGESGASGDEIAARRALEIEQLRLPDLPLDRHFGLVERVDRCTTCHAAIDGPLFGAEAARRLRADGEAIFPPARRLTLPLVIPSLAAASADRPANVATSGEPGARPAGAPDLAARIDAVLGFALASEGVLARGEPMVARVFPRSPAAWARLRPGDLLLAVNQTEVADVNGAEERLAEGLRQAVEGRGRPEVVLSVRRGLPQPYAAHPRLDLFVGPGSPHPKERFGCTICHEGEGSATDFVRAAHQPDSRADRRRWEASLSWSPAVHAPRPMLPVRFAESRCALCHHALVDLDASERWPNPPAPKLVEGYRLVRELGCFGCHEIRGIDSDGRTVGPDLRLEPAAGVGPADPPGTLRKVGPSLRRAADKTDRRYIVDRLADPLRFLPRSRMPRLFGLHEHLDGAGLDRARRYEVVEQLAVAEYLMSVGDPAPAGESRPTLGLAADPTGGPVHVVDDDTARVDRGRRLFGQRGCLACHAHADFPGGGGTLGPDLSGVGLKYTSPSASRWLAEWLRDPATINPRTRMPNPLLAQAAPSFGADHVGAAPVESSAESRIEPADGTPEYDARIADLVGFLRASTGTAFGAARPWSPPELPRLVEVDLDTLVVMYLASYLPRDRAERGLRLGFEPDQQALLPPDAQILAQQPNVENKLRYVGGRTIARRGCFGCHDIPRFERADWIGPALSNWGNKPVEQLGFEQAAELVVRTAQADRQPTAARKANESGGADADESSASDTNFYIDALVDRRREGFLWQKLAAPRSFDYHVAGAKGYTNWLTMGRFQLDDAQREAIITFVLGLVGNAPERYVACRDGRRRALADGRKLIDEFACAECHVLALERWTVEYAPGKLPPPPPIERFARFETEPAADELARSAQPDLRGQARAELIGAPRLDTSGRLVEDEDAEGRSLHFFTLWRPAAIDGAAWAAGGAEVPVPVAARVARREPWGGRLARWLYPAAVEQLRAAGAQVALDAAWGWLPPPLVDEGAKVQNGWLIDYLVDPRPIRPSSLMRMPRYSLSIDEARRLADYFAAASMTAVSNASVAEGTAIGAFGDGGASIERRRRQAVRVVTDRTTFCLKCHTIGSAENSLAGSGGAGRANLAPRLDQVSRRLEADYLRRWIARPRSLLPYTPMPVNFPPGGQPVGQDLLPGKSEEQIDALVDLLLHYDEFLRDQVVPSALISPEPVSRGDERR